MLTEFGDKNRVQSVYTSEVLKTFFARLANFFQLRSRSTLLDLRIRGELALKADDKRNRVPHFDDVDNAAHEAIRLALRRPMIARHLAILKESSFVDFGASRCRVLTNPQ